MIVRGTSSRAYEFACHSAACAPPSAGGSGGSLPGAKGKAGHTSFPKAGSGGGLKVSRGASKGPSGSGFKPSSASVKYRGKTVVTSTGKVKPNAAAVDVRAKKAEVAKAAAKAAAPAATGGPTATWAKRAGFPAHATGKGNVVTIKNADGSVTKVTHAKNGKGEHKFDTKTTKDGYEIHDDSSGYSKGYGGAQSAARSAARQGASDKSASVKAYEKDYGVRRKDADPNSLQARYKGRSAGVRFPKDLQTNAAGDIIIRPGGGYNPNAGAKLGTMSRQESGKGWQGTLEDGHVVKSKTRAGVIAATVRYIQK